jgi:putative transcriptional regulator
VRDKAYVSDALAAIHETASDLQDAGLLDRQSMREFDKLCLTPVAQLTAEEVKAIREAARVSQRVFAAYLNVSPGVVSQWERGEKRPSGPSLKLMAIVRKRGLEAIA